MWTVENINALADMIEDKNMPAGDGGNKIARRLRAWATPKVDTAMIANKHERRLEALKVFLNERLNGMKPGDYDDYTRGELYGYERVKDEIEALEKVVT